MDLPRPSVKRRYDKTSRQRAADQTRRRIVRTAGEMFLAGGYVGTNIAQIAREAGVSSETIYKSFGGKPGLVKAVFQSGVDGTQSMPTEQRARRVSRETADPAERLRSFGRFVAEVTPRVAPLMLLVRSAAETDPALAEIWRQMNAERLASMARHARQLFVDGHLRAGVTAAEARDVLWLYSSPEMYDLLVRHRGWGIERYGRWVGDMYVAALLAGPGHDR